MNRVPALHQGDRMTPHPHPESDPPIRVRELTKVFRDFWRRPRARAVNTLSFDVRPGEVFGLLGPNGSGKSTTLKLLLGLLHPTAGTVSVFGHPPDDVRVKSRIGYLPEETHSYPFLSAEETLDFYGTLFDLPRPVRRQRIDELLAMIGLTHARRRMVGEFSKGMARRIGLAQALMNDPDLVILDEPTSGLDPIGCRQMKDIILTLARRGKTVLLSSHLLADVEDVCDRVLILYGGRAQAMGALHELLEDRRRTIIELPDRTDADLREPLRLLRERFGDELSVEHPRRSLEQFFLELVERARGDRQDADGALPETRVAAFLQAED